VLESYSEDLAQHCAIAVLLVGRDRDEPRRLSHTLQGLEALGDLRPRLAAALALALFQELQLVLVHLRERSSRWKRANGHVQDAMARLVHKDRHGDRLQTAVVLKGLELIE
jgi:hypothetical protein